jgi:hypothetical protein
MILTRFLAAAGITSATGPAVGPAMAACTSHV